MENTKNERKDAKGNIINKLNKDYHVSFKEDFAEIIQVESYKEYNILNDKNDYINNLDDNEDDEDEDNEDKFDIKDYNPVKIERMANHDPTGFSRTKCIVL